MKKKTYIRCSWMEMRRVLVNPDGQVWPCCYFCNSSFSSDHARPDKDMNEKVFQEYYKHKDELNLKKNSMESILNHEWFTQTLPESWEKEETRVSHCRRFCEHYAEE